MFAPHMILVPTDFSEYSDKALATAVDIAKQHNAAIELLHVIGIIHTCTVDYCFEQQVIDQIEKNGRDSANDQMAKQVARVPGAQSVTITTAIRKGGAPYDEILQEQQEKKMDLIVIATHGTTGLLHYLMGSVAEKVAKGAKCPVLLVRKE